MDRQIPGYTLWDYLFTIKTFTHRKTKFRRKQPKARFAEDEEDDQLRLALALSLSQQSENTSQPSKEDGSKSEQLAPVLEHADDLPGDGVSTIADDNLEPATISRDADLTDAMALDTPEEIAPAIKGTARGRKKPTTSADGDNAKSPKNPKAKKAKTKKDETEPIVSTPSEIPDEVLFADGRKPRRAAAQAAVRKRRQLLNSNDSDAEAPDKDKSDFSPEESDFAPEEDDEVEEDDTAEESDFALGSDKDDVDFSAPSKQKKPSASRKPFEKVMILRVFRR